MIEGHGPPPLPSVYAPAHDTHSICCWLTVYNVHKSVTWVSDLSALYCLVKQWDNVFVLNSAALEAFGPLDKRRWRQTSLLTWKRERETQSEVFMFEAEFVEEFRDTARDVIKQLQSTQLIYSILHTELLN